MLLVLMFFVGVGVVNVDGCSSGDKAIFMLKLFVFVVVIIVVVVVIVVSGGIVGVVSVVVVNNVL